MVNTPSPARSRIGVARICTIVAFVFAVLAIFLSPAWLFGLIGVILGAVGAYLGDRPLGWYAAVAAVVGALIGSLF